MQTPVAPDDFQVDPPSQTDSSMRLRVIKGRRTEIDVQTRTDDVGEFQTEFPKPKLDSFLPTEHLIGMMETVRDALMVVMKARLEFFLSKDLMEQMGLDDERLWQVSEELLMNRLRGKMVHESMKLNETPLAVDSHELAELRELSVQPVLDGYRTLFHVVPVSGSDRVDLYLTFEPVQTA